MMLHLGKFNKLVKVEALKCANKAFMRSNSLSQSKVVQIAPGIGRGAGDTNDSVRIIADNLYKDTKLGGQTNQHIKAIDPTRRDQVNTSELYDALCALSVLEAYNNFKVAKSSSRKKSGLKYLGFKLKSLPFRDAYGPLSNSIVLQPFSVRIQQSAHEHQSANIPGNPFYNSKRFEYEHTERTNVGFVCPTAPRKSRKKNEKMELYRKMDCASLKEAGAIAAVLSDKPKRFGCKTVKKPQVNKQPNACGEIFECPKKVVEQPKKDDCAVSEKRVDQYEITQSENQPLVTVLIQQEFVQYFQNVLGKINRKLNLNAGKFFAYRDIVSDLLAAHMASITPTHTMAAPYKLDGWSTFQTRNQNYERNRGLKQQRHLNRAGPRRSVNRAYQSQPQGSLSDDARMPSDAGLRISDAELLKLTLKHSSDQQPASRFNGSATIADSAMSAAHAIKARQDGNAKNPQKGEEISSFKSRDILDEELVATPASVLTPLLPPRNPIEQNNLNSLVVDSVNNIYSSQGAINDFSTLTIEGGKVEFNCTGREKCSGSTLKAEAAKEFKPLPGQVCCPKEDAARSQDSSLEAPAPPPPVGPPPQICCPPKDKTNQTSQNKPPEDNQVKAAASPEPEIKPTARRIETTASKKPSKRKKTPKEDPNVFNCCLSVVGQRKVEINNCPMPVLYDDGVILKMHSVALGPSDVYLFDHGVDKEGGPVVLGHEGSGIVYKVGKNVKHLRPGDAVAIEPGIACGVCPYCKSGRYNLCPAMKFNGLLQTYCSHPAHFCYKIPKDLDPTHAALTHPVAMALHACRKAHVGVGSTVLVLGACPLGLSIVMTARAMGADKIIVVDTLEKNLKLAYELCADKTILATADMTSEHLAEKICCNFKANPNVVIDCCGCSRTVNLAGMTLKPGGFFVLAGCQTDCASLNILAMLAKEICACASFRTCNEFVNAMCLIGSKRANVARLITHKTEFCEAQEGFEWAVDEEKSGAIKVLINWPHTEKR